VIQVQEAAEQQRTTRFRICRETRTYAGIKTESVGLFMHAPTPEEAISRAKHIMPWLSGKLVAIAEAA
jgi:hypothetical protein